MRLRRLAPLLLMGITLWIVHTTYRAVGRAVLSPQLKMATARGEFARVEGLLAAGADPNFTFPRHIPATPLMTASFFGHVELVKLLVDRGAHLEKQDEFGVTALMLAADGLQPEVVRELLARGAQPHTRDRTGHGALWWARQRNVPSGYRESERQAVIRLLRAAGAVD